MLAPVTQFDRGARRRSVQLQATLRIDGKPVDASIEDLSSSGFSAVLAERLAAGARVQISSPSLGTHQACVVRVDGDLFGFAFDRLLPQPTVDAAKSVETLHIGPFANDAAEVVALSRDHLAEPSIDRWPGGLRLAILVGGGLSGWAVCYALYSVFNAAVVALR
jgi:hypothetical protein